LRCVLVHAHPLDKSLTRHFLDLTRRQLEAAGHTVETLDLYQAGFDPRLTAAERASHYGPVFDHAAVENEIEQLLRAEVLVIITPTWWFGPPAILKGWFDRVFAPGAAFDHSANFGPLTPRLNNLRHVITVTTLGSPWWVDWIAMRRPMRRILKTAIIGVCAPNARFSYLPFYAAERRDDRRVARFTRRLTSALIKIR
jgi:NAD(P)H dehydrogenase (quinone)